MIDENEDVIIGICIGYFVCFKVNVVCNMGCIVIGVWGVNFCEGDKVVGVFCIVNG